MYASADYKADKWNLNSGIHLENSISGLSDNNTNEIFIFLPHSIISYSITNKQQVKLSYRRQIKRPTLNQLDTYPFSEDLFSTIFGNPGLSPEVIDKLYLDYSIRFGNHYLSHRLYYTHVSDAINKLSFLNDVVMETEFHNLGDMNYYGYQLTSSVSLHKSITVNSNMKLFAVQTLPG